MKVLIIIALILISPAANVMAWWASEVDTVEVFYPDGNLKEQYQTVFWSGTETTYKYGFYRSWYENGNPEREGCYERDLQTGTWVKWDNAGYRIEEVTYLDGLKHGPEIEWNQNGTVRKLLHYHNGVLHGLCSWWKANYNINDFLNNPNLTLEHESFYLGGVELVTTKTENSKDFELSCSDGRSPYYDSALDLWVEWKMKDCCFFVGRKVNGKKDGLWVLWTKTGDMKKAEYYDAGTVLTE
ncbi:MAG: hypothetical protein JXA92_07860 [candidate division Zixibacteria bacterium]|nr:hypothetical protein [candidate division Zixibacteria bacterium]